MITGPYTDNRNDNRIQQDTLGYQSKYVATGFYNLASPQVDFTGSLFGTADAFVKLDRGIDGASGAVSVVFSSGNSLTNQQCDASFPDGVIVELPLRQLGTGNGVPIITLKRVTE